MSKMKLGLTAFMLSGVALFSGVTTTKARAQGDGGAFVYHGCPADYGEISIDGYDIQYCVDLTATPSEKGNATLHGWLSDPSTAPKKTVTVTGFPCYAGWGGTRDTRLTITPSGEINGSCKYH